MTWGISLSSPNNYVQDANCLATDLTAVQAKISQMGYVIRNVGSCIYETVQSNYYGADLGDGGRLAQKLMQLNSHLQDKLSKSLFTCRGRRTLCPFWLVCETNNFNRYDHGRFKFSLCH